MASIGLGSFAQGLGQGASTGYQLAIQRNRQEMQMKREQFQEALTKFSLGTSLLKYTKFPELVRQGVDMMMEQGEMLGMNVANITLPDLNNEDVQKIIDNIYRGLDKLKDKNGVIQPDKLMEARQFIGAGLRKANTLNPDSEILKIEAQQMYKGIEKEQELPYKIGQLITKNVGDEEITFEYLGPNQPAPEGFPAMEGFGLTGVKGPRYKPETNINIGEKIIETSKAKDIAMVESADFMNDVKKTVSQQDNDWDIRSEEEKKLAIRTEADRQIRIAYKGKNIIFGKQGDTIGWWDEDGNLIQEAP